MIGLKEYQAAVKFLDNIVKKDITTTSPHWAEYKRCIETKVAYEMQNKVKEKKNDR